MSTRFFEQQTKARRNTAWLVAMFVIATSCIVIVTFFAVTYFANVSLRPKRFDLSSVDSVSIHHFLANPKATRFGYGAAIFATAMILGGTAYKVISLRHGGGRGVAESVGGRRVVPDSAELSERRLLNIVEEMAIASGTPVPPVYLLEEPGINAFAAGYSSSDAVIGVTRGALNHFDREQLQGVIAHEFSHILNGDMRMNIRMIGILHGILLLALIGRLLFRLFLYGGNGQSRSSDSRNSTGLYIVVIALVLIVIGSIGSLFGGMIKAAVSRQREYLADASAVQFTRNPDGIAGALKKIGGYASHGRLQHPNAAVASHMYFAQGIFEGLSGLMATHPPLPKRIRAIDPNWNGKFARLEQPGPMPKPMPEYKREALQAASGLAASGLAASGLAGTTAVKAAPSDHAPLQVVASAVDSVGTHEKYHRVYAADLLDELDPRVRGAAREPYSARALVFAILLDQDPSVRKDQITALSARIEPALVKLTLELATAIETLPDKAYLPVVDLSLPALSAMSKPQYSAFMNSFVELARADSKITIFEWTLAQVLMRHLRPRFEQVRSPIPHYYGLQRLGTEISMLLSILARVGHPTAQGVQSAFDVGARRIGGSLTLQPREKHSLSNLETAVKKLQKLTVQLRGKIVDGCAAVVCADGTVEVREAELLRGIADLLDCPVPPLIEQIEP
ncbi:hypothetical protein Q31b_52630 [Novipirellula aureliae]|uniref:Peptidase M48 domain-containing protein n=1 Tax=Novipirellula aureliae TaxID=2527966 RepID=A0A5C6DGM5_9BACT|nr:M48 family metallopeptidase [Novipirellula aureliae]TWU35828.1 hypothetical protein Q31b_52630 [Novipirellula aureliae]